MVTNSLTNTCSKMTSSGWSKLSHLSHHSGAAAVIKPGTILSVTSNTFKSYVIHYVSASSLHVFKHLCCSTVFKVHGARCLQWVCEQLQHCDGSGKEDVRLQTWLPGIPQGLRKTHKCKMLIQEWKCGMVWKCCNEYCVYLFLYIYVSPERAASKEDWFITTI